MCGIAGIVNDYDIKINKLVDALRHRGPDDQTIYTKDNVALIHTRLAIQDIQNGIQPFHYQHYSIIFNGEIYNHLALRKQLHEFNFQTNSDTETLLYLFIKYQFKMFDLIDGMFAFCIYNSANRTLILARDRAGKKPLYYYADHSSFLFASELNALKSVKTLAINTEAIHCYLRAGFIWQPFTAYQQVFKLPAGTCLTLNTDTLTQKHHSYFDIRHYYEKSHQFNFTESLQQVENKLKQSIADRIAASDVEVGVFLSGGIDSNLIAAMAAQIKPKIKTFTVKFSDLYDESSLAKLTANQYGTEHHELSLNSDLQNDIEKILLAYGEPFMDSSAIPSYYVSREARKHVKVILAGDGADELFAGYRRYVPIAHSLMQFAKIFSPLHSFLPKAKQKQSAYNYFYRLITMSNKRDLDFYLSATTDIFEDIIAIQPHDPTLQLYESINKIFTGNLSPLKKMLLADFSALLFCDLLVKMDIASMANSLEVRSPFLAKDLLEFAPQLPDHFKIKGLQTKYILRKLAEKYLPPLLVKQPKRGFEVPLTQWIERDLRENIHDALTPGCYVENFIERKMVQQLLQNQLPVAANKRAKMLWSLYCLETWHAHETY